MRFINCTNTRSTYGMSTWSVFGHLRSPPAGPPPRLPSPPLCLCARPPSPPLCVCARPPSPPLCPLRSTAVPSSLRLPLRRTTLPALCSRCFLFSSECTQARQTPSTLSCHKPFAEDISRWRQSSARMLSHQLRLNDLYHWIVFWSFLPHVFSSRKATCPSGQGQFRYTSGLLSRAPHGTCHA